MVFKWRRVDELARDPPRFEPCTGQGILNYQKK